MFMLTTDTVSCGGIDGIPVIIPQLITLAMNAIKIAIPIILIFMGMLDMGKAVMAQKEDEIKKGQQMFIKRLIAAALVFLIVFFVQLVIGLVAPSDKENVISCIDTMINYSK